MAEPTPPQPRRRRRRKWLAIGGILFALLIAFVGLLPTLVSWGLGHGLIRNAINQQINGSANFDRLDASWFGSQSLENFTIVDASGRKAVDVDVRVSAGLFQVLTQRPGPLSITMSGEAAGEIREDGSTSFGDLVRPQPQPPPPSGPFRLPELPPLTVNITAFNVNIKDLRTGQTLALQDLNGAVNYQEPTQPITLDLTGKTITNGTPGTLTIRGNAENLFNSAGDLTLGGASAVVEAKIESPAGVPIPLPPAAADLAPGSPHVKTLNLQIASDDLTARIVGALDVVAQIEGHPATSMQVQAALGNMLTNSGELSLRAATANLSVEAQNLPFVSGDLQGAVNRFKLTAVSNDLTQTIVIAIDSTAQISGHPASTLAASLSVDELFAPNGALQLAIEKITGTVQSATVPTAIAQPMLANTPIVLARDVGPVLDVNASFSAGQTRHITIVADAAALRAEAQATVDPQRQSIEGQHLLVDWAGVHPDVVKWMTQLAVDRPVALGVRLTSFTVPAFDERTKSYPLQQFAAAGRIVLIGTSPVTIQLPSATADESSQPPAPISFAAANVLLQFETPALAQHVDVTGSGLIDGASVTFSERITNLFNVAGKSEPINALPAGTLTITNLPAATLARFAPEQRDLIDEIVGPSLSATVTTTQVDADLAATIQAKANAFDSTIHAVRRATALHISGANTDITVTPRLASLLQKNSENPINVEKPATITVNVQPLDMPQGDGPFQYGLPLEPIRATVEIPQLIASNLPAVAEPLELAEGSLEFTVQRVGEGFTSAGKGDLILNVAGRTQDTQGHIANLRYRFDATTSAAEPTLSGLFGFSAISVARLERALGRQAGELSQWTGNEGELIFKVEGAGEALTANITSELPHFRGQFIASKTAEFITLTGETNEFRLPQPAVQARLNPAPQDGTANTPALPPSARVLADIPMVLQLNQVRVPTALLSNESFDPKAVTIDIALTGGPVRLTSPAPGEGGGEVRTTLRNLQIAINTKNLAEGVQYTLRSSAEVQAPEAPPASATPPPGAISTPRGNRAANEPATDRGDSATTPGAIDVAGKLTGLVNEESKLQFDNAKVQMTANVKDMPTAVADAVAKMQGLIVAAVGPVMNATFKVDDFSTSTGRLDARIDTTNGWLEAVILGREQSFRMRNTAPLKAELAITPPLRDRLLYKINPILADIRSTEHPLRASGTGIVPADFDLSKLSADFEIDIGKVEFDSGSTTMTLLRFAQQDKRAATIPGEIEPIVGRVRNGILTYRRFNVRVDKWEMAYSGQVDLVKQTMDLRTELPLKALGHTFQELEPYADKIVVPIVVRGKFGEAKPTIDPNFDIAKEALRAGFTGTFEQILKGRRQGDGPSGNILEEFFKRLPPR